MSRCRSWGRHPAIVQEADDCRWRADLPAILARGRQEHGDTLAFGNGRSYGDSCLSTSGHLLRTRPLGRFIGADWQQGVVRAEAGVTLEELLALAIPKGWFLPVTPGTSQVTLGGALANDVHGKNHHAKGSFGLHVKTFGLVRSDRGTLQCSNLENPELFAATIGGLGLTGLISWIELQLIPIVTSDMDVSTVRFGKLDEFFRLADELEPQHEFTVAWVDCLARGAHRGRGVFQAANFAAEGALEADRSRRLRMPVTPPVSLFNRLSLRPMNALYWQRAPARARQDRCGYAGFFYPLDAVDEWNRAYGPHGFQQYQAVVPAGNAEPAISALLAQISASGHGSFLAVLKRFGPHRSPGWLSFPMEGTTLALDFPRKETTERDLFARLDAIVREAKGRLYPAKDSHMRAADFQRAYPNWERMEMHRDPALKSLFWHRVTS